MISRGIFGGLPLLRRSQRPSRPPASKRSSQVCTHLLDRMRLATVSLTLILRTRTMRTASILRITLESFSFLYAFSSSSRFATSMTWLYGRGSLLLLIWQICSEQTFSRHYSIQAQWTWLQRVGTCANKPAHEDLHLVMVGVDWE